MMRDKQSRPPFRRLVMLIMFLSRRRRRCQRGPYIRTNMSPKGTFKLPQKAAFTHSTRQSTDTARDRDHYIYIFC